MELKSLLIIVKEENEKSCLKLNIETETKAIIASDPITSLQSLLRVSLLGF